LGGIDFVDAAAELVERHAIDMHGDICLGAQTLAITA